MPSVALMRVRCVVESGTWPSAAAALHNKMSLMCPSMPYEVVVLNCQPALQGNPNKRPDLGPPWEFTIECQLTVGVL